MHVVDAVETDDAFDTRGNSSVGVVAVRGVELVAGERHKRGKMGAGGIADEPDALGVEVVIGGLGADELHGGLHVIDRRRVDAGFSQPVIDGEHRIAGARQEQAPIAIELFVADLPAAAMDGDQHRRLAAALGQIKIADKLGAVVLGKDDVGVVGHFVLRSGCLAGGEQRRRRCGQDELGEHRHFSLQACREVRR